MATSDKPPMRERLRQFAAAFTIVRQADKRLVPLLIGAFLAPVLVAVVVAALTRQWVLWLPPGVVLGVLVAMIVFSRRAADVSYAQIEGQPGAAAAVASNFRGNWRVTPGVAVTVQQDVIHRVVGVPGVILLIEGSPTRLKNLIAQEKKRISRVVPEIAIYDVVVGDGEGQVPLRKLQSHFVKMPRNITPKQINAVESRLAALGAARPPMPKGPLPKGARLPKGAKLNRRG